MRRTRSYQPHCSSTAAIWPRQWPTWDKTHFSSMPHVPFTERSWNTAFPHTFANWPGDILISYPNVPHRRKHYPASAVLAVCVYKHTVCAMLYTDSTKTGLLFVKTCPPNLLLKRLGLSFLDGGLKNSTTLRSNDSKESNVLHSITG